MQTSIIRPTSLNEQQQKHPSDAILWLEENSNNKWAVTRNVWSKRGICGRPRAALISLVRNAELDGILQSMRQLEYRWNEKYQYPWIFFNDEPFTEDFKVRLTHAPVKEVLAELTCHSTDRDLELHFRSMLL